MRWWSALAGLVVLSGCFEGDPALQLQGEFVLDVVPADSLDFHMSVEPYSDNVTVTEGTPSQFTIQGIIGGCEDLRRQLASKPYIASVSPCVVPKVAPTTSSPPRPTTACHTTPDPCP